MEGKKIAAALAAVNQYLVEEAETSERTVAARPGFEPSIWALAGRQRIMQNRELLCARLWR